MSDNSSNAPPASRWRKRFRLACLLSLAFAICLMLISNAIPRGNVHEAPALFLIFDACLALAELLSWVAVGICGIAWMLSPRR